MTPDEVYVFLNDAWDRIDRDALREKDSQSALGRLESLYLGLSEDERKAANDALIEWLLSGDQAKQFDALAMIRRFSVRAALPALRELSERFEESEAWSAPYDWAAVNRVIGDLASLEH